MKKSTNKKGFTLIELMVVVGVLGVLMAIAIPAYNGIEARAYQTVCNTNKRNLATAWSMYKIVNNNVVTAATATTADDIFEAGQTDPVTGEAVVYFEPSHFPRCPSDTTGKASYTATVNQTDKSATFTCPVTNSGHEAAVTTPEQ